jgi:hypothetical protein
VTGIVGAILGSVGLGSILYALLVLAQFGRKLGAVTKMREVYKLYYVAAFFVAVATIVRFLRISVFWAPLEAAPSLLTCSSFYLFLYHVPLAAGLSLGLAISWYYWGWLMKER